MKKNKIESDPLISVIIPVYNSEKYIGRAIESVLNQSYKNIELIIVNDGSTDKSGQIINSYTDNRIFVIHKKHNSGAAYLPRKLAIESCKGSIIVALDADDYFEKYYVEKLYDRMRECSADICLGKMVFIDEEGEILGKEQCIPNIQFDYSLIISGKEAFFFTVPEWKIGMNGCMAKKDCWTAAYDRTFKFGGRGVHDDENVSRYILLSALKVVFYDSTYFYTVNSLSVTHVINRRIFDWMKAEENLLLMIDEDFGKDSLEYKTVEENDFNCYYSGFIQFIGLFDSIPDDEIMYYLKDFRKWHDRIDWEVVKKYIGRCHYLINRYYYLELFLYLIRYGKFNGIFRLVIKVFNVFILKIKDNKYYKWYIYRKKREKLLYDSIKKKYAIDCTDDNNHSSYVVNIIDGSVQGGGLADRLRGIISTYAICKEKNIPYRLLFNYPFDLTYYLIPNEYEWRIDSDDLCHEKLKCNIVILDTTEDSSYQYRKQERFLWHHIKNIDKQTHVFTNAAFAYNLDYSGLFNELFKPSERLQSAIDRQKEILGEGYISVSARFLDLLGDFNETFGYGKQLSEDEAEKLINSTIEKIIIIHDNFPDKRILVNSDSAKFIEATSIFDYTYSIPGFITHIDNKQEESNYERYEKTFLDFMMIANADKIFLLKGNLMFKSGYPYAASKIYNREFNIIEY